VALIQERLGLTTTMTPGRSGQYEVLVDGEVIAARAPGFWQRLLGGGWPDHEAILSDVQRRLDARRAAEHAE
jgi:predicted Rdx family selenoprotein